jgi:GAF domain-containing protein
MDRDFVKREADRVARENAALAERKESLADHARRIDAQQAKAAIQAEHLHLQEQYTHVTNLYVTVSSLHLAEKFDGVFDVVREVVANLIGCESIAIYLRSPESGDLRRIFVAGVEVPALIRERGVAARVAETRQTWLAQRSEPTLLEDYEAELSACLALRSSGGVVGVLSLFELLPQKGRLDDSDIELLELLAAQAGRALHFLSLVDPRVGT